MLAGDRPPVCTFDICSIIVTLLWRWPQAMHGFDTMVFLFCCIGENSDEMGGLWCVAQRAEGWASRLMRRRTKSAPRKLWHLVQRYASWVCTYQRGVWLWRSGASKISLISTIQKNPTPAFWREFFYGDIDSSDIIVLRTLYLSEAEVYGSFKEILLFCTALFVQITKSLN